MFYKTCPTCGANLDPGERCDCRQGAAMDAAQPEQQAGQDAYTVTYRKTYRRTLEKLRADGWPMLEAVRMAECHAQHEAMDASRDAISECRMLSVANALMREERP